MLLAARIVVRLEGHRDNGPVTRAAAHAQQHAGNRERARQQQRTADEVDDSARLARLHEVLEELRQLAVGALARLTEIWACGQNLSTNVDNERLGRERRESAARWAWRFEYAVARTLSGGLWRDCSNMVLADNGAGHVKCRRSPMCFSSACPRDCSPPRAAALASDFIERPLAARRCRSPGIPSRAGRAGRPTGRTHESRSSKVGRHSPARIGNEKRTIHVAVPGPSPTYRT